MDSKKVQEMDKVSGLSDKKFQEMDKIVAAAPQVKLRPEDKVTGIPKTLLDVSQGAGDLLRTIGLGGIADMQSASPLNQFAQKAYGINPTMKSEDVNKKIIQTPLGPIIEPKTALEDTAGAASWMLPGIKVAKGTGLAAKGINAAVTGATKGELFGISQDDPFNPAYPIGGAVLEPLMAVLKSGMVTKKGAYSKIQAATEKGRSLNWDDEVANVAKEAAKNKPTSVKKALDTLLGQETPVANIGKGYVNKGAPEITSTATRELREELGTRLQKDWMGNLRIPVSSAEQQATNILRRTVSQALKKAAPDIRTPDAVYSFYSKIHGDAPTWAKRIIVLELLKKLGGQVPGIKPLVNAIPVP